RFAIDEKILNLPCELEAKIIYSVDNIQFGNFLWSSQFKSPLSIFESTKLYLGVIIILVTSEIGDYYLLYSIDLQYNIKLYSYFKLDSNIKTAFRNLQCLDTGLALILYHKSINANITFSGAGSNNDKKKVESKNSNKLLIIDIFNPNRIIGVINI